jgi:hypothetical protein
MRASAYPAEDKESISTPTDIMPLYVYLMSDESLAENGNTLKAQ